MKIQAKNEYHWCMKLLAGCSLSVIVAIETRTEAHGLVIVMLMWGFWFFGRELFCDFGDNFVMNDVDGEEPISNMVASITKVRQTQID